MKLSFGKGKRTNINCFFGSIFRLFTLKYISPETCQYTQPYQRQIENIRQHGSETAKKKHSCNIGRISANLLNLLTNIYTKKQ